MRMPLLSVLRQRRLRLRLWGGAGAVLAVLCLVPPTYVARAKILPQDSSSLGLGATTSAIGAQAQSFAALLGGAKTPIDLYLSIARGYEVSGAVIDRLHLADRAHYGSQRSAYMALDRKVDVHSLTGGVIEIEVRGHDAGEAVGLTRAYVAAISDRLAALGRDRIDHKRAVVMARLHEATARVATAEAQLAAFRHAHNLAAPEAQLGSQLSLRAGLQAQLQAKVVELETLQRFEGDENPHLQAVRSEIGALRGQIASTAAPADSPAGPNVAGLSAVTTQYLDLYRDYAFAQALYEVYARAAEEVQVEALAADTVSDAEVIEAPRLDMDRKYNTGAVALLLLLVLAALFVEVYAPATGIALPGLAPRAPEPVP